MYGLLMTAHVVFGLFFGLTVVCISRGLGMYALAHLAARERRASGALTTRQVAARTT
jgi:hypothetical protein